MLFRSIRDSLLGENPHHTVAMKLVFERTIRDCRERMLVQAEKSSQIDPVSKTNSSGRAASTPTAATHPTTTESSLLAKQSKPTVTEPLQLQALQPELQKLQTEPRALGAQIRAFTPQPNLPPQLSRPPQARPPRPQAVVRRMSGPPKPAPPNIRAIPLWGRPDLNASLFSSVLREITARDEAGGVIVPKEGKRE